MKTQYQQLKAMYVKIYASKNICKVSNLQTQIFLKKYAKIKPEDLLNCVKKFDSSLIPPCKDVLLLKIKRVHLIVRRWASAIVAHPSDGKPEDFGWTMTVNIPSNGLRDLQHQGF